MKLTAKQLSSLIILQPEDLVKENQAELIRLQQLGNSKRVEEANGWHTIVFYKDNEQIGAVLFDESNKIITIA